MTVDFDNTNVSTRIDDSSVLDLIEGLDYKSMAKDFIAMTNVRDGGKVLNLVQQEVS